MSGPPWCGLCGARIMAGAEVRRRAWQNAGSSTVATPRQSHGAARNQMPKLSLSEARRRPATAMMSFSSWQSTMMAK